MLFPVTKPELDTSGIDGVDITPWKHFKTVSILATVTMVLVYILLSPIGLVDSAREKTIEIGFIVLGIVTAFVLFGVPLILRRFAK